MKHGRFFYIYKIFDVHSLQFDSSLIYKYIIKSGNKSLISHSFIVKMAYLEVEGSRDLDPPLWKQFWTAILGIHF